MTNPAALNAAAKGDLDNFLVASTPGGIEAQEAAGQRALVSSFTQLPKDMGDEGLKLAEAMGFKIGSPVDELFVAVEAPEGWRMDATDHSMHSEIRDDAGRKRGCVFYKAAFYDRRADGYWLPRYAVERVYPIEGDYNQFRMIAKDRQTGGELMGSPVMIRPDGPYSDAHRRHSEEADAAGKACEKFINALFWDWKNPAAYWGSDG